MLGYEEWWKTLEKLIAEFRKKKLAIPSEVMTSLKSAKTLIEVYGADLSRVETISSIEEYLLQVESVLINFAEEKFGPAFVKRWINKLEKARKKLSEHATKASRFIPGLPKTEYWIRILPSDDVLRKDVEGLASQFGLSCRLQEGGYILVYGNKSSVKDFVKKMANESRKTHAR
ncbi:MAG: DUF2096 family protein [Candidatus Bathyarchaeota archaeon]|nr:DUF2096 family protein [Candidatus Bathyarchaeota archaeon]